MSFLKYKYYLHYKLHLQVKYFTSYTAIAMILNRFNEVLYKLRLQFIA